MKWTKANDTLPKAGEPILIRSHGIFQLATYNDSENIFVAKNGDRFRVAADLLWSGVIQPENKQLS